MGQYGFRAYQQPEYEPMLPRFIKKMQEKWDTERPTLDQFLNPDEHQKYQNKIDQEQAHHEPKTPESIAAEYAVMEAIYEHGWMGNSINEAGESTNEIFVTPASNYDDFFNHIDVVVNIQPPGKQNFFIGLDVTTGKIDEEIDTKLNYTNDKLRRYHMPAVDFFRSADKPSLPHGHIEMPRIVIGIDRTSVEGLTVDLMTNASHVAESSRQLELIQECVDQLAMAIETVANHTLQRSQNSARREFNTAEQALTFVKSPVIRQQLEKLHPNSVQLLDAHATALEYFTNLLKEKKSSIGEIDPNRAHTSGVFRRLAPRGAASLLAKK